jgi:hypothetical protein
MEAAWQSLIHLLINNFNKFRFKENGKCIMYDIGNLYNCFKYFVFSYNL